MTFVLSLLTALAERARPWLRRLRPEHGQATAEYALVMLGAAAIAAILATWAVKSGSISKLFDAVVDQLIDQVG